MKTKFLFPHTYKLVGWILLIFSTIFGAFVLFGNLQLNWLNVKMFALSSNLFGPPKEVLERGFLSGMMHNVNLTATIAGILCLVSALMVAFSKEKHEDEFIAKIRLESLLWATYINSVILILCFLFFYDFPFFYVLIFNMYSTLVFFIIRYNFILLKTKINSCHEELS